MSGHSHWANIQHSKAANDAKRGKLWSKLARRIIVAAKAGGGNPEDNLQLRYAIDDAKAGNMPKNTIENAIKKGTGELGAANYEAIIYEGYGPGGVAFLAPCLTDNRNRTAPEMRKIFERAGGQLGTTGCVGWMFDQKGTIFISAETTDEETIMEVALEAGGEDVLTDEHGFEVICDPADFQVVKTAIVNKGIAVISAKIGFVAQNTIEITDIDRAKQLMRLMENLEDHDDVQAVYANFEIADEIVSQME